MLGLGRCTRLMLVFLGVITNRVAVGEMPWVRVGVMLDWWSDDASRLALIQEVRAAVGDRAMILANANDRQAGWLITETMTDDVRQSVPQRAERKSSETLVLLFLPYPSNQVVPDVGEPNLGILRALAVPGCAALGYDKKGIRAGATDSLRSLPRLKRCWRRTPSSLNFHPR